MRKWISGTGETQDVTVLLFPRFSNHCLANAIEPLRAANALLMREAYCWRFVTLEGEAVVSSSGLPVVPNGRLRDDPGGEFLFVMSSYDMRDFARSATSRALNAAARRFGVIVGMDTGAWLMAHAGLLDGRTATIHSDEFDALSESFPAVEVVTDRYAVDGNRMSCGGAMTTFDLVLALIRRTHGTALAMEVSAFFLHRSAEAPPSLARGRGGASLVEKAVSLMSANLESPLAITEIARRLHVTQRSLGRAFQADLGAPPKTVYKRLRLAAARRYAQQSRYSVSEIALRCGYVSAASMTRAFVEEYARPPSSFRS